jgi:Rrf2 family protein
MNLSRSSSYALHAVTFLAAQKDNARPVASHHIAQAQGIPDRFLLKILKSLVSAGVLLSLKGPNGGYRLARPADQITLLDVLEAVDGPMRGQAPLLEKDNGPLNHKLEAVCNQIADQVREDFAKVPVSELVTGKGRKPDRAAGRR